MKYSPQKFTTTKEDKDKYTKRRKDINAEKLGILFQQNVEKQLAEYMNLFAKVQKLPGEGFCYKSMNHLTPEQTKQMAIEFFKTLDPELEEIIKDLYNQTNPDIKFIMKPFDGEEVGTCYGMEDNGIIGITDEMLEKVKKKDIELYNELLRMGRKRVYINVEASTTDSLGDVFTLVHELTHFISVGKNSTKELLDEAASQCMERVLEDYILNLSDEDIAKYGLKKERIKRDLDARKLVSFVSRYNSTKTFNELIKQGGNKEFEQKALQYMLAQIYQSQFTKFDVETKKKKIIEFLICEKEDNFEEANKIFGINLKSELNAQLYINQTITDLKKVIFPEKYIEEMQERE